MTDRRDELRQDLPLLARLGLIGALALTSAVTRNSAALLGTVLLHTAWPISVLAPMCWRREISHQEYVSASGWFMPGLATLVAAAFGASRDNAFPATALVIAVGAVHLLVVLALMGTKRQRRWMSIAAGASLAGIAGALADLPAVVGWNLLALAFYGAVGVAAVSAAQYHAISRSTGSTS